jgi:hypothetical protein
LEPAPAYAGGNGTEASPYLISSVRQLKKLATDIELSGSTETTYQKYFELTTDLEFSADNTIKQTLIGSFYGILDGKGHVIKDLNIDGTGKSSVSVFGGLAYGEIKNLGREGGSITDMGSTPTVIAAGLVSGLSNGGKLTNCYNSSSIINTARGAGLAFGATTGIIENCYNTGDISVAVNSGGLIGSALGGGGNLTVINSYNTGNVTATGSILGGLVGLINNPLSNKQVLNISNCFNYGEVVIKSNSDAVGSIMGVLAADGDMAEVNATNVYSRPGAASATDGSTPKPDQPIGWYNSAAQAFSNATLAANPTLREDAKYTLEYSKSAAFVTELGSAFKSANGRTPKLAWEK